MSKTHRDRRHNYRTASGRCEACGSRLVAGDWHLPGPGGSVQCAHCRPMFGKPRPEGAVEPPPEPEQPSRYKWRDQ